jgi:neutral amino acid transport system permease protein
LTRRGVEAPQGRRAPYTPCLIRTVARFLLAVGVLAGVLIGVSTTSAAASPAPAGSAGGRAPMLAFQDEGGEGGDEPEQSLRGTLDFREDDEQTAVEGVTIRVLLDGEEVGTAESAEDGTWEVGVPAAGTYTVQIDVESLPDGVDLRDEDRAELTVRVREGQKRPVVFALGPGRGGGRTDFERFATLAFRGLVLGMILGMCTLGLALIFGVTGLVNFAHGELVTFGALVAFFLNGSASGPGMTLLLAVGPALLLSGALGFTLEKGLFLPLRRRRAGNVSLIVVTIGLSLVLRHLYLIFIGGRPQPFSDYTVQREFDVGPVSMLPKDLWIIGLSFAVLAAVGLLLSKTRTGTAMRAVADNRDLAAASGIDVERVTLQVWVLGATLAGFGGILVGVRETVVWDMGFGLLLLMFAAMVVGGLGSAYGAALGAVLVNFAANLSTYWLPVEFKLVVALGALIVVLLVRPQGILGLKERVG